MEKGAIFDYEIIERPNFSLLKVYLKDGQKIQCERGTMVFFSPSLEITTRKAQKGFLKSLKRMLASETFLLNEFTANGDGELGLAPSFSGDIRHLRVPNGKSWVLFSGAFIASSLNVVTETKWQGLKKAFFSGESAFTLNITPTQGDADVFIGAYGAFIEKDLEPGEVFNCDNGHLVAMESSIQMNIKRVGNWKATLLSGEGVITELIGPGKVIMQTRNVREFALWLSRFIPSSSD
ncbi:MAG: TIGR00266 family protein [Promethearchaeota archaeon]